MNKLSGKLLNSSMLEGDGSIKAMPAKVPDKIAVCMPCRSEMSVKTAQCMIALMSHSMTSGLAVAYLQQEGSCIAGQRNDLVERAIDFNADWILWIDSDMTFPRDALSRLIRRGKQMVGATYNKRVPPYDTLGAWIPTPDLKQPDGGVHECYYLPGGFMLIHTDVYKALPYPWYFETYRAPGSPINSFLEHLRTTFLRAVPPEVEDLIRTNEAFGAWIYEETQDYQDLQGGRKFMSEDYNFCRKARDRGFRIWGDLDLSFQMGHIGDHIVTCERPPVEAAHAAA